MPLKKEKLKAVKKVKPLLMNAGGLIQRLLKEQRYEDANKAAADAGFREKLFEEYVT